MLDSLLMMDRIGKRLLEEPIKTDRRKKKNNLFFFFISKGLKKSQQMFTDLNKHAVKTSNSIAELYDSRDGLAVVTRKVVENVAFLMIL